MTSQLSCSLRVSLYMWAPECRRRRDTSAPASGAPGSGQRVRALIGADKHAACPRRRRTHGDRITRGQIQLNDTFLRHASTLTMRLWPNPKRDGNKNPSDTLPPLRLTAPRQNKHPWVNKADKAPPTTVRNAWSEHSSFIDRMSCDNQSGIKGNTETEAQTGRRQMWRAEPVHPFITTDRSVRLSEEPGRAHTCRVSPLSGAPARPVSARTCPARPARLLTKLPPTTTADLGDYRHQSSA